MSGESFSAVHAEAIAALCGHRFADDALWQRALTHASFANENPGQPHNEVLEFTGDAVIQLCATLMLVERFAHLDEGALTTRRQWVVQNVALADVGAAMGLPALLRLGGSERKKRAVEARLLGSAVEALFAALFHEAGFEPCMAMARRWLTGPIDQAIAGARAGFEEKPAKNQLQEILQARKPPSTWAYADAGHVGPDNDRTWRRRLNVDGMVYEGTGATKQKADEAAARLALAAIRYQADQSSQEPPVGARDRTEGGEQADR